MKLRSGTKHNLANIKQEISSIGSNPDTENKFSKDSKIIKKHQLYGVYSKEECSSSSRFVGAFKNDQNKSKIHTLQRKNYINNCYLEKVDCINIEIKQEVTAKSESLLSATPGMYDIN